MKKANLMLSLAAIVLLSVPAFAGEGYEKCSAGTQECLDKMAEKMSGRGWVGVELEKDEDTGAMTVTRVVPGSPAEDSGLQAGDKLVALNGFAFGDESNHEQLQAAWKSMTPGKEIAYTVNRHGHDKKVSITLVKVPEDVMAAWIGSHMLEHAAVDVGQN
ncbi:MAG: PDZ domain-containing protein [Acidobacteria bacterium]|nr:PDZ domain-containing protein [Acidobacteriota bacterium]